MTRVSFADRPLLQKGERRLPSLRTPRGVAEGIFPLPADQELTVLALAHCVKGAYTPGWGFGTTVPGVYFGPSKGPPRGECDGCPATPSPAE